MTLIDSILLKSHLIFAALGDPCRPKESFFGLPTWYKYLKANRVKGSNNEQVCSPALNNINDIWLILLAGIEILLRIAILIAIFFVLYGGIKYINSRGNADKVSSAKNTVVDAIIGLIIAIVATSLINFIGRQISS